MRSGAHGRSRRNLTKNHMWVMMNMYEVTDAMLAGNNRLARKHEQPEHRTGQMSLRPYVSFKTRHGGLCTNYFDGMAHVVIFWMLTNTRLSDQGDHRRHASTLAGSELKMLLTVHFFLLRDALLPFPRPPRALVSGA